MQTINPDNVHQVIAKHTIGDGFPLVFDPERSHESFMYDSRSKSEYLDLFSFFASMPLGYNHAKMQDKAFKERLGYLATFNPTNSDIYCVEYAEFIETFATLAGAPHFNNFFFVAGGALGVENALKTAFDWKARKTGRATAEDINDLQVIHFNHAFHGRTGYTLTLTNTNDPKKYLYFPKFDWPRVSHPTVSFPIDAAVCAQAEEKPSMKLTKQLKKMLIV